MNRKVIVICITTLILLTTAVFAVFSQQNRLTKTVSVSTFEKALEQRIRPDEYQQLKDILKRQGYYPDKLQRILSKYIQFDIKYKFDNSLKKKFLSDVDIGKDLDKVLDIYLFLYHADKNYSLIDLIYEEGAKMDYIHQFWIEEAFNQVTGNEALTKEDIHLYISQGLTISDIQTANRLSFKNKNIKEILDTRVKGTAWNQIATALVYPEKKQVLEQAEQDQSVFMAIDLSNILNDNASQLITKKGETVETASQKLEKVETKISHLLEIYECSDPCSEEIKSFALSKLPSLSWDQIQELMEKGYHIKQIETAIPIAAEKKISIDLAIEHHVGGNIQ